MRKKTNGILLTTLLVLCSSLYIKAQVKISQTPGAPHSSAVLELEANDKGFLLPSLTTAEMLNISSPKNGLLIFNKEKNEPFIFKQVPNTWYPIYSDSAEWKYDNQVKKVFLNRALINNDSIYYDVTTKKMFFGDFSIYNNSLGSPPFSATDFSGKFYFKSTASKYLDTLNISPNTMNVIMEVDSNKIPQYGFGNSSFTAAQFISVANPLSNVQIGALNGIRVSTLHAANDTAFSVTGIENATTINGKGNVEIVTGLSNAARMSTLFKDTVGTMYGIRNTLSNSAVAPYGEISGNMYGYFSTMSTSFANRVAFNVFGIYLGNITGSKINRNYAIYTNSGVNRIGDSLVISNTGAQVARAIFDVNSTTAMIIPTGSQAQRPAANLVTGMTRYNVDNGTIETYTGASWAGIIRNTQSINIPVINPNNGYTASIFVNNATIGSAVTVSPDVALPSLLSIAWARVSATNTVEIRFLNGNGTATSPIAVNFNIRIMQ
jgi:hypothetical protein